MTRRRRFMIACIISVPVALAAACSFPEVDFTGSPGDDGGGGDARDGQADGEVDADTIPDVIDRDDASQRIDANACVGVCDCDNDGYILADSGCAPGDAGPDAKFDCDDYDPLRNPGRTEFVTDAPQGHEGDWNCDGTPEKAYKEDNCSPCRGAAFAEVTRCGTSRNFFQCVPGALNLSCDRVLERLPRAQACR